MGLIVRSNDTPRERPLVIHSPDSRHQPALSSRVEFGESSVGHPADWILEIGSYSPSALETALIEERRKTIPGDPVTGLRQQLMLHLMARQDARRALRIAGELDMRGDGSATALVLSTMGDSDPRAAAAFVLERVQAEHPLAASYAGALAGTWARCDLQAAEEWARSLPQGVKPEAWSAIAAVRAGSDPTGAAAFISEMSAGAPRAHGAAQVAEVWARSAPAAALTWAAGLSTEDRYAALPVALTVYADTDPAAAAAWVQQQAGTDHLPQDAAAVVGAWSRRDPAAAARWVAALPAGPLQSQAMSHLVYDWTAREPERASAWLREQPPGAARDEAIAMLSLQTTATDPEAAALWAADISDPARRSGELRRTLSAWIYSDGPAARVWMEQRGLTTP